VTGYVAGRPVPSTVMRPTGHASRLAVARLVAVALVFVVVFVVVLAGVGIGGARPAAAHTDVEFTLPTDGASVGVPLDEVTVGFTAPVTLIGPGFEVLDPSGDVLTPFVVTDDDRVFRLQLDPPLAGGEAAVRFEVRAEDGHTITGGFAFTVTAEPPTTTSTTTPTTSPPTSPTVTAGTTPATTATPTVPATTSTPPPDPTTRPGPAPDSVAAGTAPAASSDDGPSTGAYVGIGVVVALAAAALLALRIRSSPPR
jgi:methionine-rich copper-binding protein CopC